MRRIAILILATFVLSSIFPPISASNVAVTVQGQQVQANLALSLVQNVTSLPKVQATIGADANASAAFTQALRNTDPAASASNLSIQLLSTGKDMNVTCTFSVSGVSQINGDILSVNMTWLPFAVKPDMQAQNFSFNTVGSKYLRSIVTHYANASRFVGLPSATITGVTFFVNGTSVGPPAAQNYVGNFTTLNFSPINPNIEQWNRTYTVNNDTTTWRYFLPKSLDFDMRIQRKNVTTDYTAKYGYNATISVPGVGRAEGSVVLVGVGGGQTEWVMVAIVVLAIVSTIIVQLRYRNGKRRITKFQRK